MDPELRRRLVAHATMLRKRDRAQLEQAQGMLPPSPESVEHLEDLAQKLALARQAELRQFADTLGASREATGFLDRQDAAQIFDNANTALRENPELARRRFETAQALVPHPATEQAIQVAEARRLERGKPPPREGFVARLSARIPDNPEYPQRRLRAARLAGAMGGTGRSLTTEQMREYVRREDAQSGNARPTPSPRERLGPDQVVNPDDLTEDQLRALEEAQARRSPRR